MTKAALLLAVLVPAFARAEPETLPRLWTSEFALVSATTVFEGIAPLVWEGRLATARVVLKGFTLDARAQFTAVFPIFDATPVRGSAELRVGWTGRRWAAVAGLYLLDGFTTAPRFVPLPSARVQVLLDDFSLVLGLYDFHIPAVPLRISFEGPNYGVGWVFPFGVAAHALVRLIPFLGVNVQAMVAQTPGGSAVVQVNIALTAGVRAGKPPADRYLLPDILDPMR